jgi:hypothetical protein
MEFILPMAATSLITLAMAIVASIIAAIPFFRTKKSDILTLPVGSSWLQQKHEFRINGPKLIEEGFLAVSVLRSRISPSTVANAILNHQSATGVFRVVYLNGTSGIETLYQIQKTYCESGTYLTIISPQHWLALCTKKEDEVSPAYQEVMYPHQRAALVDDFMV